LKINLVKYLSYNNYFVFGDFLTEAMATELIIDAYWSLKNYWTKVRVPLPNGSDFDVVAYNPNKKHLVVAESKAQNIKERVYVYNNSEKNFVDSYCDKFLCNIPYLWNNDEWDNGNYLFDDFNESVTELTIHLVSNTYVEKKCITKAEKDVKEFLKINGYPFYWKPHCKKQIINFLKFHQELDLKDAEFNWNDENKIDITIKGENRYSLIKEKIEGGKIRINLHRGGNKTKIYFKFDNENELVYKSPLYQNLSKAKNVDDLNINIVIDNHFELFCKIQECMKDNKEGSRFGNPILDVQRELYRYFNPDFDKKFDDSKYKEIIKEKLLDSLIDSSKKKK
jgi:hypothetical protein